MLRFAIFYEIYSMQVSFDENGSLINLLEKLPKAGKFFCPACKSEVILKSGQIKMPHFAHKSLKNCEFWAENESEQHLSLKKELYDWTKKDEKIEVEKYLPQLEQTPDLLVNDKIALEVQCSRLSIARLRERTKNYKNHDYHVFWLLGRDLWLREKLDNLQRQFLYFSQNLGFYLWELDLSARKIRLKYLIHENPCGQICYLTKNFPFGQGKFLDVLRFPYQKQLLPNLTAPKSRDLKKYVAQQLYFQTPKWLKIQGKYYENGRNILDEIHEKAYFAPIGLNLLTVKFNGIQKADFCQISQDLTEYYQNFLDAKQHEKLYPPAFYVKMKE